MNTTRELRITLACSDVDLTRALLDGRVAVDGVDLAPLAVPSAERHWRMLRGQEFDACELSLSSYLMVRDQQRLPLTAIPVFPHRRFRHGYAFVNAAAGIHAPADLNGRRVGVRTWQATAGVWLRGILAEHYGVDLSSIRWHRQDEEDVPLPEAAAPAIAPIPSGRHLDEMLLSGEIDAVLHPDIPPSVQRGDPRVRRLFADPKTEEQAFYRKTGLFPLMHTVAVRASLLEAHPWLGAALVRAFEASKAMAMAALQDPHRLSLAWYASALQEQQAWLGRDPWRYGFAPNRANLSALIAYAAQQGLIRTAMPPASLFFPPTLDEAAAAGPA